MADAAENFSSRGEHRARCVGFERMAESIIDGQEKPGVAALGHDRSGEARRQCVAVVDPRCFGCGACLAREGRASDCPGDGNPIAVGGELLDSKRDG